MQISLLRILRGLFLFGFQDIQQSIDGDARLAHLRNRAAQASHWEGQLARIIDERQIHAQRDLSAHAHMHTQHHNGKHLNDVHHIAQRPEAGEPVAQIKPEIGVAVVLLAEFFQFQLFPAKGAHHAHAREILLHDA